MNNEIKFISPFKKLCVTVGNLPTAYLESMSYYECLTYFMKFLENEVIPAINNNSEVVEELQNYVNNYFDNLDVQTEIDNKLDEMAESGQLLEIITSYLELSGVLGFDTVADMQDGDNFINGTYVKTFGKTTFNDGYGANYKIRTKTNADTPDGEYLISLNNYTNLIAEKENKPTKKVIMLGDSYANRDNSWMDRIKSYQGLTNANCVMKKVSGVGFYNTVDGVNFSTMVVDNIGINPYEVTDIVVCGGWNDQFTEQTNLLNAISNFLTLCKNTYPNADVYIGFIGWCKPPFDNYENVIGNLSGVKNAYNRCGYYYNKAHYLNNVEYSLHNTSLLDETNNHPNTNGQLNLAINIERAWITGSTFINEGANTLNSSFTPSTNVVSMSGYLYSKMETETSRLFANRVTFTGDNETEINFGNDILLGTIDDSYVNGRLNLALSPVSVLIKTTNTDYFTTTGVVYCNANQLYLRARTLNRSFDGWLTDSFDYIQIDGLNIVCSSMLQY